MVGNERSLSAGLARRNVSRAFDGVDLGQAASRRLRGEPGEEIRHRRAVPLVRGARARKLGRILLRLHERDRIGADVGLAARSLDRLSQDRLARSRRRRRRAAPRRPRSSTNSSRASGSSTSAWRLRLWRLAGVSFLPSRNTTGRPSSGQIGPADRQRRVGDVRAANIEQPRQIVRIADQEALRRPRAPAARARSSPPRFRRRIAACAA